MPQIVSLAERAGEAIMAVYSQDHFGTTFKSDHSPLTHADLAAHHLIIEGLEELTPELPALSEESRAISYESRQEWEAYWLIDPLDGTKEFIKRNNEFTVNIALVEKGKSTLGVVHAPALDWTYYATHGAGAFKKNSDNKPLRLSAGDYRLKPIKVAISRAHGKDRTVHFLKNLGAYEAIEMGSSLKFCIVAEGTAALYLRFGRTMEWDSAAADCIVSEAGGSVTDLKGNPLQYNKADLSNPEFIVRGNPPIPLEELFQ